MSAEEDLSKALDSIQMLTRKLEEAARLNKFLTAQLSVNRKKEMKRGATRAAKAAHRLAKPLPTKRNDAGALTDEWRRDRASRKRARKVLRVKS